MLAEEGTCNNTRIFGTNDLLIYMSTFLLHSPFLKTEKVCLCKGGIGLLLLQKYWSGALFQVGYGHPKFAHKHSSSDVGFLLMISFGEEQSSANRLNNAQFFLTTFRGVALSVYCDSVLFTLVPAAAALSVLFSPKLLLFSTFPD